MKHVGGGGKENFHLIHQFIEKEGVHAADLSEMSDSRNLSAGALVCKIKMR